MNAIHPLHPPRHGAWMQTASGFCLDLHAPDFTSVKLTEIATSLARLPRFLGHTLGGNAYSVAEHSCHVAALLRDQPIQVQRAALLHDAHEAFIGDVTTPVKHLLGKHLVAEAEHPIIVALFARFGLAAGLVGHPMVKECDLIMLATEARDLMHPSTWPWGRAMPPRAQMPTLEPWVVSTAYVEFLLRADRLGLR